MEPNKQSKKGGKQTFQAENVYREKQSPQRSSDQKEEYEFVEQNKDIQQQYSAQKENENKEDKQNEEEEEQKQNEENVLAKDKEEEEKLKLIEEEQKLEQLRQEQAKLETERLQQEQEENQKKELLKKEKEKLQQQKQEEEEKLRKEQERLQEEEKLRKEQERLQEEEKLRKEQERLQEEEKLRKEQERLQEEEKLRKEQERLQEEEKLRKEQERLQEEEKKKKEIQEQERLQEEEKKKKEIQEQERLKEEEKKEKERKELERLEEEQKKETERKEQQRLEEEQKKETEREQQQISEESKEETKQEPIEQEIQKPELIDKKKDEKEDQMEIADEQKQEEEAIIIKNEEGEKEVEIEEEKVTQEPRQFTCQERIEEGTKQKNRGNQLVSQKQFSEALKEYQIAISIAHPSFFQENCSKEDVLQMMNLVNNCLNNMGFCQLQLHQYSEASQNLAEILATDPNNIKANYRLALCYKNLKNYTLAYQFISFTYQQVKAQNQQVWNDLIRELEEIKEAYIQEKAEHDKQSSQMFKKMISPSQEENAQKIKDNSNDNQNQPLIPFNFLSLLGPVAISSTIITKCLIKLPVNKCSGIVYNGLLAGTSLLALKTKSKKIRNISFGIAVLGTALLFMKKQINQ